MVGNKDYAIYISIYFIYHYIYFQEAMLYQKCFFTGTFSSPDHLVPAAVVSVVFVLHWQLLPRLEY